MTEVEVDLDRQLLFAGESVEGTLRLVGPGENEVRITLHGEEVYRPYVGWDSIHPVLESNLVVQCDAEEPVPFSLPLPVGTPASYASDNLRCVYYLKLRRDIRPLAGMPLLGQISTTSISRLNLTVEPMPKDEEAEPVNLSFEHQGVTVEVGLNGVAVEPGDAVRGTFAIEKSSEAVAPTQLTFSLSLIEETRTGGHRQVLWRSQSTLKLTPDAQFPAVGSFELAIPEHSSTTGEWRSFRVHCGFRAKAEWAGQPRDARQDQNITILPRLVAQPPANFTDVLAPEQPQ